MKKEITSADVKLDSSKITWVLFNPTAHTYKYQEQEAMKHGFKRMDRAEGVRIYAKFYGSPEAALKDKDNIKKAITALRTRRTGRTATGIGNIISDEQFSKGKYEEPFRGWTSEGSVAFTEMMK